MSKNLMHAQLLSHIQLCDPMECSPPGSSVQSLLGKKTRLDRHFLFQGIFLTQESNPHLLHFLHWQMDSLLLSHQRSPQEPHICVFFSRFIYLFVSSLAAH